MTLNSANLTEEWGWFIDIEKNEKNEKNDKYKVVNKTTYTFPDLHSIEEDDEYEYYIKNQKDDEFDSKNIKESNLIYKVGSTTIITAVLTYIIFIML